MYNRSGRQNGPSLTPDAFQGHLLRLLGMAGMESNPGLAQIAAGCKDVIKSSRAAKFRVRFLTLTPQEAAKRRRTASAAFFILCRCRRAFQAP